MRLIFTQKRKIAIVMMVIILTNLFFPSLCFALTSGPSQPETKGFQPAGVSDMVDLQSGEFKYNIPLLDVDGYPVNLNYQSGVNMDDEASWVGLGWNLNPGAINRQVRGVPDDMSGDQVNTEHYTKPKITVGGSASVKAQTFGRGMFNGSFKAGVFSDNYTGIGAEVGANAGVSFSLVNDGALTAGLGVGILSSTANGVDASPYANLSVKGHTDDNTTVSGGLTASLGYNSRSGLKNFTLSTTFGVSAKKEIVHVNDAGEITSTETKKGSASYNVGGSNITFNTEPINPKISIPYQTHYGSFSLDGAGEIWGLYLGAGLTGYKSVREVKSLENTNRTYGFLYAERGKDQKDAVMDFIREKENPIIPTMPNLALPVQMPDMFTYTSQGGGGQFRLYRGGTGAFFDNEVSDGSEVTTAGLELGFGAYFHGGGMLYKQTTTNKTSKWKRDNNYLKNGDFQEESNTTPGAEHVYFKQVGEKNEDDASVNSLLYGTSPLAVNISGKTALSTFRDSTPNFASSLPEQAIRKNSRRLKRTVISYLTANEAKSAALDTNILSYPVNDAATFQLGGSFIEPIADSVIGRLSGARKAHHFSEITVTDEAGKRSVYGIPVYNLKQDEYSFAIGSGYATINQNQVVPTLAGQPGLGKGIDHYYHKESQPAYASSFLLTAILSPDYVDKTGNGISEDDLGTAIKFNYSKLHHAYKWRTPYHNATINRALLADADDDKASIVYGEKEIWYMHSIESKTKIAYFILKDRQDGLGVTDWTGQAQDTGNKQKCLSEIRLYSKADMSRPIKIVKFQYSYESCPGVPNSLAGGKLTLARIYFQYGNSDKGKNHPYIFKYNQTMNNDTVRYSNMSTDRWGIYKSPVLGQNAPFSLYNDEFPYTNQNKAYADSAAGLWHLKQILLPTGGQINVNYESGDYAYVQNRRAMVMSQVVGLIGTDGNLADGSNLLRAVGLRVNISSSPPMRADTTAWFKRNYLSGANTLYTKLYVKIATGLSNSKGQDWDFVPCYADVQKVKIAGNTADIIFSPRTSHDAIRGDVTANPIILAAWQKIKEDYPRYAYPGFDNRDDGGGAAKSVASAVNAIFSAFGNLSELRENFYQKAFRKKYANQVDLTRSFVRLTKANGFKLGGSARVKKIQIADDWIAMSGTPNAPAGTYGQAYDYTTTEDGQTISSGVAAYEPSVGNDENALKQPITYTDDIKCGISNLFNLEKPFGESFYPGASVVYSKVTISDLLSDGNVDPIHRTGYIVNESYTAKDFPVQVHVLPIKTQRNQPMSIFNAFASNSIDELSMSQGYSIEINDMHGKPKANRIFNQSGSEISSTVYYYNATASNGSEMKLRNVVDILKSDGTIAPQRVIGRDIEFYTDFREQETITDGHTYDLGVDVIPIWGFPIPIPHLPINSNYDYKLFRSACAVKLSAYYGIMDKVVKTQNGSSITTQNIAYDGLTGEALVTRTQNEFNKDIFSVNIPAYWGYKGMSGAYQNLGLVLKDVSTNATGEITNSSYLNYLQPGDEFVQLTSGKHYWVMESPGVAYIRITLPFFFAPIYYPDPNPGITKKVVDRDGKIVTNQNLSLVKIIRSGFRNMLGDGMSSIVCLNNPVVNGNLKLSLNLDNTALKVINASASTYDEKWAVGNHKPCNPAISSSTYLANTSRSFGFTDGSVSSPQVTKLYNTNLTTSTTLPAAFWYTEAQYSSIWPRDWTTLPNPQVAGFDTLINVTTPKTYYLGMASSNQISCQIDCHDVFKATSSNGTYNTGWHIIPYYLSAGLHRLHVEFQTPGPLSMNLYYAAFEIYDNAYNDILNATVFENLNVLFTTKGFYSIPVHDFITAGGTTIYGYTNLDGSPIYNCTPVINATQIFNPYIQGYLGNWRPYQTKVYQQTRTYSDITNANQAAVDIKNAGFIDQFYPYWSYNSGLGKWMENTAAATNGPKWVTANTVTLYDKYGQQLENKDALGRYSSAKFDFNGELPSAVASNAMNREIYANSMEDFKFMPGVSTADSCNIREFMQPSTNKGVKKLASVVKAHSGNYGALIPADGLTLATIVHNGQHKTVPYYNFDALNQYFTKTDVGLYPNGFEPAPNKKYVFNAWVYDGANSSKNLSDLKFRLSANGVDIADLKCKAIVEGWKQVEGTFITPALTLGALNLHISVNNSTTPVYIDDIRIHPFNAHMKTYAYDDKTMRLMAELDENGFATFYEYDDEGLLVRVKKETERGIMTLKESHSSYKKTTL